MTKYRVVATGLHLRSQPKVAPATKILVLPKGQAVEKIEDAGVPDWWRVRTRKDGIDVEGYVNRQYLEKETDFTAPAAIRSISAVHLASRQGGKRSQTAGRAFALDEPGKPLRTAEAAPGKVGQLHAIINWLGVDTSERYRARSGETYCNIYAYDYCYLAGVFLPRVWWNGTAIARLSRGEAVEAVYDRTVNELNANSLHNWLAEFGPKFGWTRSVDLTEMQDRANNGSVCILSARRRDTNRPGHICAVVPEIGDNRAKRKDGVVQIPLQSNAGARNFRYGGTIWWTSEKFSSFSFWFHE